MPPDSGFVWADYVDWIAASAGSLSAAADRICAQRGYKDDVASAERALRRLRRRGSLDGGTWGVRALAVFGLPDAIARRVRWLAQYHGRFTDLPMPVCEDLLRAWDRPPTTDAREGRAWLAIAHAAIAMRRDALAEAIAHLERGRADIAAAAASARLEALLIRAFVASRQAVSSVPALLAPAAELLAQVSDADDRACLAARLADHHAYELNRAGDHAAAEALYRQLPAAGPAFARVRRFAGLAYARWKLGDRSEAEAHARAAVLEAGDGGHARLRIMALNLLARILGSPAGDAYRARAVAMLAQLDDDMLRSRLRPTAAPAG